MIKAILGKNLINSNSQELEAMFIYVVVQF